MVSYKGILSATVLIFLFSPVTKTAITEEKLNKVTQCLTDMKISCRPSESSLPSTKRCIEMAFKFWDEDINFPDVVKKFYNTFYHIIDKTKLNNPNEYCIQFSKNNEELFQKCELQMADFKYTVEDALRVALYEKRIAKYLVNPIGVIDHLNLFGLNFSEANATAVPYESEIVGLDKVGASAPASNMSRGGKKFYSISLTYLSFIGNTFQLTDDGEKISPKSFFFAEYLDPEDIDSINITD